MNGNESAFPIGVDCGLTKRELFALQAPAKEIEDMTPPSIEGCAKLLGIPFANYKADTHYYQVVMLLRRKWADALIAALGKE